MFIMIGFDMFYLLNDPSQGLNVLFESILTYYILKRLLTFFFFDHRKNYDIEICSCDDMNLSNIYHSKNFSFDYNLNSCNYTRLKTFFFKNILKKKSREWNENSIGGTNFLSSKGGEDWNKWKEWNMFLVKIVYSSYKRMKKRKRKLGDDEENKFTMFSLFLIGLFQYENCLLKKKDKVPFLLLLCFSWMKERKGNKWKHLNKKYFCKNVDKEKKYLVSHRQHIFQYIYMCFKKIKFSAIEKMMDRHLMHIHVFKDIDNGKKNVIMLCKKTVCHLAKICATYIKSCNAFLHFYDIYHISNATNKCIVTNKKKFRQTFSLSNLNKETTDLPPTVHYIRIRLYRYILCVSELLKNINSIPSVFEEQINTVIIPFLLKYFSYHSFLKKYIIFFYRKFFFCLKKRKVSFDKIVIRKERNPGRSLFGNKTREIYSGTLTKKKGFSLICGYICLMYNTSSNNMYYLLIRLLSQNKNLYFYEQLNYFVDQLIKENPKVQYLWNVKKILLRFYVNYYSKLQLKYLKINQTQTIMTKEKEGGKMQNKHQCFTATTFSFSLKVIMHSKKYKIRKNTKKKEIICLKKPIRINKWKNIEKKKWERKSKQQKMSLIKKASSYHFNLFFPQKIKRHAIGVNAIGVNVIFNCYIHNFNFLNRVLEYKLHNYMPVSFLFLLHNSLFYFCFQWKNKHPQEIKYVEKNIEEKNRQILLKHIYYYALHQLGLTIYAQKVYYVIINVLSSYYVIKCEKNMYNSNFICSMKRRNSKHKKNLFFKKKLLKKQVNETALNKKRSNPSMSNLCAKKGLIDIGTEKKRYINLSSNTVLIKHHIYVRTTYIEFYLFSKKKKKYIMTNKTLYQFYQKINNLLKDYENNLKKLIMLLSTYYRNKYYIQFYINAVKNVFCCFSCSTFFFKELFFNLFISLLFYNSKITEKKLSKTIVAKWFRTLDDRLKMEWQFLKSSYCKYLKENDITHEKHKEGKKVHLKNMFFLLNPLKENSYTKWKLINGIRRKNKIWIICNFCIYSINEYSNIFEMKNSYEKRKEKKKNVHLLNTYYLFFKSVLNVIHEHVVQFYYFTKKYFWKDKYASTQFRSKEKCSDVYDPIKDITFSYNKDNNLINNMSYAIKYQKQTNSINKNYESEHSTKCGKNDASFHLFPFHSKKHEYFLYIIYCDISYFLKILKKFKFVFFYIIKYFTQASDKIKKKVYLLKFFFSINFLFYIMEHVHTFYLIKEIKKMLKDIFRYIILIKQL